MRHFLVSLVLSAYCRGIKLLTDGLYFGVVSIFVVSIGGILHDFQMVNVGVIISLGGILNWGALLVIAYKEPQVRVLILSEFPKEMIE